MNDKELLEMAAKAAGLDFDAWSDRITDYESVHYCGPALHRSGPGGQCSSWNSITDDGDALRLFGRMPFCEIYVSEIGCTVSLPRKPPGEGPNLKCDEYASEHNGDLQAAIRYAITRAAAEIGRAMK